MLNHKTPGFKTKNESLSSFLRALYQALLIPVHHFEVGIRMMQYTHCWLLAWQHSGSSTRQTVSGTSNRQINVVTTEFTGLSWKPEHTVLWEHWLGVKTFHSALYGHLIWPQNTEAIACKTITCSTRVILFSLSYWQLLLLVINMYVKYLWRDAELKI